MLEQANPALDNLNAAFPPVRAFAREILPGVRETPATIEAAFPWIEQVRALVSPAELQGLVNDLRPAVDDLAQLTDDSVELLPKVDDVSRCFIENILPTGDIVIDVPNYPHETGVENYKEFWQSQVALSGESQNFDGNGGYTRFQPGGGTQTLSTGPTRIGGPPLFANPNLPVARLDSEVPGPQAAVPARRRVPHERAAEGQRERGQGDARTMRRAIRKHLRDFIAILFLVVVAAGTAGYILSNQRFYLPAWVPGIGSDFYTVEAEFETGQAVVPGQGQSVNIAGVKVGDIGEVELEDGVAVVELNIQDKYKPIYRDAKMLLRPKTGLKDMFVELDPGTQAAGELPEDGRISLAQTRPDVNPDEILAQLDGDTRAYLQILANAGGEAFTDDPSKPYAQSYAADLRETFKRFEPTNKYIAKFTGLLSERRQNAKRAIHSFSQLAQELGEKDTQLAELVESSNANFQVFAEQEANLRRALQLLPPTLTTTKQTLGKVETLAGELGPSFQALGRSRATSARRSRTRARRCARPRRSSATRSGRSRASPAARCASCAARPRSWLRRPHG